VNLLFACRNFYPYKGGAEFLVRDLSRLLGERGHNVTVLTGSAAPATRAAEVRGVRVIRLNYPARGKSAWQRLIFLARAGGVLMQHARIVRRAQVQTVCIGCFTMADLYVLLAMLFVRCRLVIYLHGSETRNSWKRSRLFRAIFFFGLRQCDAIIAVSADLRDEVIALQPCLRQKVVVIPNGIDVRAVQRQAATGPPEKFVLFAGHLEPHKNPAFFLHAFAKASRAVPVLHLVIAGAGSLEAELRDLTRALGLESRVSFVGAVERETLYGLLKKAECIVHPSHAEGHPLILLEALAAGTWVLASDVRGNRDVIEHGRNGFLFRPGDEDQLARLIGDCVSRRRQNGAREMTDTGLCFERFDLENLLGRHLQVLAGEHP
jgi:glycosyltransferase involved in cell wall biosynthesis